MLTYRTPFAREWRATPSGVEIFDGGARQVTVTRAGLSRLARVTRESGTVTSHGFVFDEQTVADMLRAMDDRRTERLADHRIDASMGQQ